MTNLVRWLFSTNHKDIGTLYFIFGAIVFILFHISGGIEVAWASGSDSLGSGNWRDYLNPGSVAGGFEGNPPEGQPAPNPAAEQPYDAQEEGQPVEPYPYADDQVIGGDSVNAVLRRLLELGNHPAFPPSEVIDFCRIEARDLMEVKGEIIQRMAYFDPGGDWLGRGARALDNPYTATGEESLQNLFKIRDDLNETGPLSDSFSKLQEKVRRLP